MPSLIENKTTDAAAHILLALCLSLSSPPAPPNTTMKNPSYSLIELGLHDRHTTFLYVSLSPFWFRVSELVL
ncbi:hypothetical protein L2E82_31106 [Cichorium intybus]|uniref:Uncharacterized protein n=1 Tax=Cichorium intybus TaxID=13427 RepID=A0ACB9D2L7_CICIN|nr:hypothetical protein L2E82_31106 [Cichorium intybus]